MCISGANRGKVRDALPFKQKKKMYIILRLRVGEHYPPCIPNTKYPSINVWIFYHIRLPGVMGEKSAH